MQAKTITITPTTLTFWGVRLEPLGHTHAEGLALAVQDGKLWALTITSTPMPDEVGAYIDKALSDPYRIAFAVIDEQTNQVLGTTSFHDIVADIGRMEIGYTWYRQSAQRTHVNTVCKIMLLSHAFETLGCAVVGQRTDCLNTISQRAIERLGMKKDGVIRHHAKRKDGSVRDTVMYSMLNSEWASNKQRLLEKLTKMPKRSFG